MRQRKRIIGLGVIIMLLIGFVKWQNPYFVNRNSVLQGISWQHLLGTDYLGRDLFSRLILGSLYSVALASISLLSVVFVSLILGGIAGVFGGLMDKMITTIADILMSIPSIIVALVFTGFFSNSVATVLFALTISWSGRYIRSIRNLVLNSLKEEYIILAPLRGSFGMRTLFYHIIPTILIELLSLFLTDIGKILLSISGLAFLGIGVQPPIPELGTILYDGKTYFFVAPWLFIFPGMMLSLILLATQRFSQKINEKWGMTHD